MSTTNTLARYRTHSSRRPRSSRRTYTPAQPLQSTAPDRHHLAHTQAIADAPISGVDNLENENENEKSTSESYTWRLAAAFIWYTVLVSVLFGLMYSVMSIFGVFTVNLRLFFVSALCWFILRSMLVELPILPGLMTMRMADVARGKNMDKFARNFMISVAYSACGALSAASMIKIPPVYSCHGTFQCINGSDLSKILLGALFGWVVAARDVWSEEFVLAFSFAHQSRLLRVLSEIRSSFVLKNEKFIVLLVCILPVSFCVLDYVVFVPYMIVGGLNILLSSSFVIFTASLFNVDLSVKLVLEDPELAFTLTTVEYVAVCLVIWWVSRLASSSISVQLTALHLHGNGNVGLHEWIDGLCIDTDTDINADTESSRRKRGSAWRSEYIRLLSFQTMHHTALYNAAQRKQVYSDESGVLWNTILQSCIHVCEYICDIFEHRVHRYKLESESLRLEEEARKKAIENMKIETTVSNASASSSSRVQTVSSSVSSLITGAGLSVAKSSMRLKPSLLNKKDLNFAEERATHRVLSEGVGVSDVNGKDRARVGVGVGGDGIVGRWLSGVYRAVFGLDLDWNKPAQMNQHQHQRRNKNDTGTGGDADADHLSLYYTSPGRNEASRIYNKGLGSAGEMNMNSLQLMLLTEHSRILIVLALFIVGLVLCGLFCYEAGFSLLVSLLLCAVWCGGGVFALQQVGLNQFIAQKRRGLWSRVRWRTPYDLHPPTLPVFCIGALAQFTYHSFTEDVLGVVQWSINDVALCLLRLSRAITALSELCSPHVVWGRQSVPLGVMAVTSEVDRALHTIATRFSAHFEDADNVELAAELAKYLKH